MRADGGDGDGRHFWVHERATGRKGVGSGSCGSRENEAVGLDDCEQGVVAVEFEHGDPRRRAAVNNYFV